MGLATRSSTQQRRVQPFRTKLATNIFVMFSVYRSSLAQRTRELDATVPAS